MWHSHPAVPSEEAYTSYIFVAHVCFDANYVLMLSNFLLLPFSFDRITFNLKNKLTVLIKEFHSIEELVITSHTDHDLFDFDVLRDSERFTELHSSAELDRCCPVIE